MASYRELSKKHFDFRINALTDKMDLFELRTLEIITRTDALEVGTMADLGQAVTDNIRSGNGKALGNSNINN